MCSAVPNVAVFCSSLISSFASTLRKYLLKGFEMVPVSCVIIYYCVFPYSSFKNHTNVKCEGVNSRPATHSLLHQQVVMNAEPRNTATLPPLHFRQLPVSTRHSAGRASVSSWEHTEKTSVCYCQTSNPRFVSNLAFCLVTVLIYSGLSSS